jgi:hypothetical protein
LYVKWRTILSEKVLHNLKQNGDQYFLKFSSIFEFLRWSQDVE